MAIIVVFAIGIAWAMFSDDDCDDDRFWNS